MRTIDIARTQLGVAEATGNNDGIPAERYMRGDKLAWCAGFLLWCNDKADDDEKIAGSVAAYYPLRAVKDLWAAMRTRAWVVDPFHPRATVEVGDLVFFNQRMTSDSAASGWHVGIVDEVLANGRITTIEGNVSDKVARRDHFLRDARIIGFARIPKKK